MQGRCEECGEFAEYRDSVPDSDGPRRHGEFAYRVKLLCWLHALERLKVATSRVELIQPDVRPSVNILTREFAE